LLDQGLRQNAPRRVFSFLGSDIPRVIDDFQVGRMPMRQAAAGQGVQAERLKKIRPGGLLLDDAPSTRRAAICGARGET